MVELEQQPQVGEFDNKPVVEDIVLHRVEVDNMAVEDIALHRVEEGNMAVEGSNILVAAAVVPESGVVVLVQCMQAVVLAQTAQLNQNLNRYSLLLLSSFRFSYDAMLKNAK